MNRTNGRRVKDKPGVDATLSFCELCLQDELGKAQKAGRTYHVTELREMVKIISRLREGLPKITAAVNGLAELMEI